MSQLAVIYIGVFCAVLLALQGAYWYFTEDRKARGAINRRLTLTKQNASARDVFEEIRRERGLVGLGGNTKFAYFENLFLQTGLRLDGKLLIGSAFLLGLVLFALFGLAFGYGLLTFVLSAVLSTASLFLFLLRARSKRIAKFSEQLPDAIDVIVRGVRSGYPFTIALGLVGKEMADPIGTEFGMTSDEINFGSSIGAALDNVFQRVGHEDLLYLTMALKIQNETGGNLAEILSRLSRLLRERAMLRLKIRAITAEGRMSAIFLSVMPFLLFGVVSLLKPDYYTGVSGHPVFMPSVVVGLTLLIIGNLILYRMVNFKV